MMGGWLRDMRRRYCFLFLLFFLVSALTTFLAASYDIQIYTGYSWAVDEIGAAIHPIIGVPASLYFNSNIVPWSWYDLVGLIDYYLNVSVFRQFSWYLGLASWGMINITSIAEYYGSLALSVDWSLEISEVEFYIRGVEPASCFSGSSGRLNVSIYDCWGSMFVSYINVTIFNSTHRVMIYYYAEYGALKIMDPYGLIDDVISYNFIDCGDVGYLVLDFVPSWKMKGTFSVSVYAEDSVHDIFDTYTRDMAVFVFNEVSSHIFPSSFVLIPGRLASILGYTYYAGYNIPADPDVYVNGTPVEVVDGFFNYSFIVPDTSFSLVVDVKNDRVYVLRFFEFSVHAYDINGWRIEPFTYYLNGTPQNESGFVLEGYYELSVPTRIGNYTFVSFIDNYTSTRRIIYHNTTSEYIVYYKFEEGVSQPSENVTGVSNITTIKQTVTAGGISWIFVWILAIIAASEAVILVMREIKRKYRGRGDLDRGV